MEYCSPVPFSLIFLKRILAKSKNMVHALGPNDQTEIGLEILRGVYLSVQEGSQRIQENPMPFGATHGNTFNVKERPHTSCTRRHLPVGFSVQLMAMSIPCTNIHAGL